MFLKPDQQIQTVNIECSKCHKHVLQCKCKDRNQRMHNFRGSTLEDYVSETIGESLRG